jgi:hypothetical protein
MSPKPTGRIAACLIALVLAVAAAPTSHAQTHVPAADVSGQTHV